MKRTVIINVVGLTAGCLGQHTPAIRAFLRQGAMAHITPAFPAVTCTAQSNYLTGAFPSRHGIVGNGWYNRELAEVQFWKQSNHLVQSEKIWDCLRVSHPEFTCANLFWWFNMYSSVDFSITPRPMYPADGRKLFDTYSWPYSIREELQRALGPFPFPGFWGPAAGIDSPAGKADCVSRWIADAAQWIENKYHPGLHLVYLPHLDYNMQRLGPNDPAIGKDLKRIDAIVGDLISFFNKQSVQVVLLSEYGITPVNTPIHLNRLFRQQGWISIKEELGLEVLNCGASKVFAVADHQVAHIYVNDRSMLRAARTLLEKQPGISAVMGESEKAAQGLDHPRAGDYIAVAAENAWFTYYYWEDDASAPDFARTVDIHRKPGYDPVELFLDPKIPLVKLRILKRLLQKRFGFRMLMDVIPLDASLVKGSHGRRPKETKDYPIIMVQDASALLGEQIESTHVFGVIQRLATAR